MIKILFCYKTNNRQISQSTYAYLNLFIVFYHLIQYSISKLQWTKKIQDIARSKYLITNKRLGLSDISVLDTNPQ